MYVVDFFTRLFRKSNIPVIIYLSLNFLILVLLFASGGILKSILLSLILYIGSISVALSPLGEWVLRKQTNCNEIKRQDIANFIYPLFNEVYARAKYVDPTLPDDIKLYMNNDEQANAFATGRKTVCITEGMLRQHPQCIKAALAHEFGHLSHKDTDVILVVSVGNFILTVLFFFVRVTLYMTKFMFTIANIFSTRNFWIELFNQLSHFILDVILVALMALWTQFGLLLIRKSSRDNEFLADEFSLRLGYGKALCHLLDTFKSAKGNKLFANLMDSHPDKNDRIARLQSLGVQYRRK